MDDIQKTPLPSGGYYHFKTGTRRFYIQVYGNIITSRMYGHGEFNTNKLVDTFI